MRVFLKVFKISIYEQLQYRFAYISGIICQFFFGILYIMLYRAFYESKSLDGFSVEQMASYVWLGQMFYAALNYWDVTKKEISRPILSGDVAYRLLKPLDLYDYWFYNVFSKSISSAVVRFLPILIISLLLPTGYGLTIPKDPINIILFFIVLFLSIILLVTIKMIMTAIVMKTLDARGVYTLGCAVLTFLAGGIVPIPLLPLVAQNIIKALPFSYTIDFPYRVFCEAYEFKEIIMLMGIQIVWIIVFFVFGKLLFKKQSKSIVVQGG